MSGGSAFPGDTGQRFYTTLSTLRGLGESWRNFATNPIVSNGASFISGFVPFAGEAQDLAGATVGVDLITGERIPGWQQNLSRVLLVVPFVGAVSIRQGGRALNKVTEESSGRLLKAYRVFGEGEAAVVRETRHIPNVDKFGRTKKVFLSATKHTSAKEALQVGRLDPRGPLPTPKYGAEVDLKGVKLERANLIEGGTDIEAVTYGSPRVKRLFRLDE